MRRKAKKYKLGAAFAALCVILAVLIFRYIQSPNVPSNTEIPQGTDLLEIYGIDVGQGDSTLIRIPGESGYFNLLIDTGVYAKRDVVTGFLDKHHVKRLDAVVATHPHADHMGAMSEVIKGYDIGEFYMPKLPKSKLPTTTSFEKMLDALIDKEKKITYLGAGDKIPCENALIDIIGPVKDKSYKELNDYSVVLKLTYGEKKLVFTGDSQLTAFSDINKAGYSYSGDLLKIAHHGSGDSTSKSLIKAVNPQIALIYCGLDNDYGHPDPDTVKLLEKAGCKIMRTDKEGNISIKCDGKNFY